MGGRKDPALGRGKQGQVREDQRNVDSQDKRNWKNEVSEGRLQTDKTGKTLGQVGLRGKRNLEEQAAPQDVILKA